MAKALFSSLVLILLFYTGLTLKAQEQAATELEIALRFHELYGIGLSSETFSLSSSIPQLVKDSIQESYILDDSFSLHGLILQKKNLLDKRAAEFKSSEKSVSRDEKFISVVENEAEEGVADAIPQIVISKTEELQTAILAENQALSISVWGYIEEIEDILSMTIVFSLSNERLFEVVYAGKPNELLLQSKDIVAELENFFLKSFAISYELEVSPEFARVYVNNRFQGYGPDLSVEADSANDILRIEAPGYLTMEMPLGEELKLSKSLVADPNTLVLDYFPKTSRLLLEAQDIAFYGIELNAGFNSIMFRKTGWVDKLVTPVNTEETIEMYPETVFNALPRNRMRRDFYDTFALLLFSLPASIWIQHQYNTVNFDPGTLLAEKRLWYYASLSSWFLTAVLAADTMYEMYTYTSVLRPHFD
jgi:hypothetical protein